MSAPLSLVGLSVEVAPATRDHAPVLRALLQFYVYELSDLVGVDVGADGRFVDRPLEPLWDDGWRQPFLVAADGHHAGFAFVSERSRLTGAPGTNDMAEFFVLRKYRRRGVGAAVATHLFDRFPGPWEVRQIRANQAATLFWRAVVRGYTHDTYDEIVLDDARWRGPVQRFISPGRRVDQAAV